MSSPSASGATKRPLEDSSSPNVKDEHDSKRPALEKLARQEKSPSPSPVAVKNEYREDTTTSPEGPSDATPGTKDIDTHIPDAPQQGQQAGQHPPVDESQWIHIRALITSAEAATVIGKGGENVTQIRKMAEAKCTVSDYQRGAGERILTVSGAVDAVAKVNPDNRRKEIYFFLSGWLSLTCLIGFWPHHPHTQQRASRPSVVSPVQDLSVEIASPSHPHWFNHRQGWFSHSRDSGSFRCQTQCLGIHSAVVD